MRLPSKIQFADEKVNDGIEELKSMAKTKKDCIDIYQTLLE